MSTPIPLVLWIEDDDAAFFQEYAAQGHTIITKKEVLWGGEGFEAPDLVLWRSAHHFAPDMRRYLPAALKSARAACRARQGAAPEPAQKTRKKKKEAEGTP